MKFDRNIQIPFEAFNIQTKTGDEIIQYLDYLRVNNYDDQIIIDDIWLNTFASIKEIKDVLYYMLYKRILLPTFLPFCLKCKKYVGLPIKSIHDLLKYHDCGGEIEVQINFWFHR